MPKLSKSLLIKAVGGSVAATPAVGGLTYAVITQREYEGLKTTIRTLETETTQQKRTITEKDELLDIAREKPGTGDQIKNQELINTQKAQIEKLKSEKSNLEQKLNEEESKNSNQFNQIRALKLQLEAKNKEKVPGSDELKEALRKEINKDLIEQIVDENNDGDVDNRDWGRHLKSPILIKNRCDDRGWTFEYCWKQRLLTIENGKLKLIPNNQWNKAPSSGDLYDQLN